MSLFKDYNQFSKENLMENKSLAQYAKPIEDLKKEYSKAVLVDISSRKVSYDKYNKKFEMDEKDFGKNLEKSEHVILYNSKNNTGILMVNAGKYFIKSKKPEYTGMLFKTDYNFIKQDYRAEHELLVKFKKPIPMSFSAAMSNGFHGSLD